MTYSSRKSYDGGNPITSNKKYLTSRINNNHGVYQSSTSHTKEYVEGDFRNTFNDSNNVLNYRLLDEESRKQYQCNVDGEKYQSTFSNLQGFNQSQEKYSRTTLETNEYAVDKAKIPLGKYKSNDIGDSPRELTLRK